MTGAAHCALAPYWAKKLGKTELTGFQASRRGGVVGVRALGDRVALRGQAVTVMRGACCAEEAACPLRRNRDARATPKARSA